MRASGAPSLLLPHTPVMSRKDNGLAATDKGDRDRESGQWPPEPPEQEGEEYNIDKLSHGSKLRARLGSAGRSPPGADRFAAVPHSNNATAYRWRPCGKRNCRRLTSPQWDGRGPSHRSQEPPSWSNWYPKLR